MKQLPQKLPDSLNDRRKQEYERKSTGKQLPKLPLKRLIYIAIGIGVVVLIVTVLRPAPVLVDIGKIQRGELQVTVDAEGKTRVRDRFTIAAAIDGNLARIPLEEGDTVKAGQVVARIDPLPLNASVREALGRLAEWKAQRSGVATQRPKPETLEQARSRIQAARSNQQLAQAKVAEARAALEQAKRDRERAQYLESKGAISRKDLEIARLNEITKAKELEADILAANAELSEVKVAQAALAVLQKEETDPDYLLRVYDARIASTEAELAKLRDEAARTDIYSPIVGAIAICFAAASLGAFNALRRVISLPPAEAMRPEPPARFRPTIVERMGWQSWLSPVGRIILRNLERKPIQAFLSILGIALAVAMLVSGRYAQDVMNYLIDVQFQRVQRDDVTIVFNEPRPTRTFYEVERLPGVLRAETFRSVPARLRFEHRSHKVGIMGLDSKGELRNLLDRQLNPVNLPLDGILLTTKLAEILGIRSGEILTVQVLEGARPVRQVPFVGQVDELVGISAYMDIRALNRLMREDRTISGAFLAVDALQLDRLYAQLKQTPAITSVALRQATIERFQETIAQSRAIVNTILVIFACIIAFGVVYNAARIALSERGRELATLRILGFSRFQVAVVLLGEQVVLTLAAIPLGFLVGYGLAALLSQAYNTELYRLPLIVTKASYAFAFIVIAIAALVSGSIVRRQLDRLDLIAVLKTRE